MPAFAFWASIAVLAWVYVGYPLVAWLAGRLRPVRLIEAASPIRTATIGIAAYNEDDKLADRVRDVLAQTVPFGLEVIVASDGSTDRTATVMDDLAADPRVVFVDLPRGGQTAAQRGIFAAAHGEVVVLTDAETRFEPGCLGALIRPFDDPRVGCTTGRLIWLDTGESETARNEGAYWRYEQLVRSLESRAGWLTAVTGALLAVRSSAYRPVPDYASMDHLLPLYAREQGLLVLAIGDARASDRTVTGSEQQFRNRSRTATRGIRANLSMASRLAPWRRPSAALAIWSHKLLRWATPMLGAVAVASASLLALAGEGIYALPVLAALLVLGVALIALARPRLAASARWASLPLAILVVNAAFLQGWINVIRGRRIGAWHRTDWAALPPSQGPEPLP